MDLKLLNTKLFENKRKKEGCSALFWITKMSFLILMDPGAIRGHLGMWGWVFSLLLVCCCYPPQAGSWSWPCRRDCHAEASAGVAAERWGMLSCTISEKHVTSFVLSCWVWPAVMSHLYEIQGWEMQEKVIFTLVKSYLWKSHEGLGRGRTCSVFSFTFTEGWGSVWLLFLWLRLWYIKIWLKVSQVLCK